MCSQHMMKASFNIRESYFIVDKRDDILCTLLSYNYRTPLERTDTEEFRRKEARAKRLASEIENVRSLSTCCAVIFLPFSSTPSSPHPPPPPTQKQDWPALNENFDSTEEERQVAVETLCLM